jgi:biotin carboxyl carrier protein
MPRQFKVTVNGREYDVEVLELTSGQPAPSAAPSAAAPASGYTAPAPSAAAAPAAAAPASAGAGDVLAGMGGVVVEVSVKVGQTVAVGDKLAVLEAMKMKSPVISTRAGQVTRVLVAAGDPVEGGQPMLTIG